MSAELTLLTQIRKLTYMVIKDLTPEQFLCIPDKFDNNIAWNLGHMIVVQQLLTYARSGLKPHVSDEMVAMYRPGTSPADWTTQPDMQELFAMSREHIAQLTADYAAGQFANYGGYTSSTTGINLTTIDEALGFNNYHEGLHMGAIMAIKNLL